MTTFMAKAASTPNKAPEAPGKEIEMEISQTELLRVRQEFLKLPEAQKKKEVLIKLLSPLIATGYLVRRTDRGYTLDSRAVASSSKEESQKTAAEKTEQKKVTDTAKEVSKVLLDLQNAKTTGQIIAKNAGKDAYVLQDVFTDAMTDMLDNGNFIDTQLKHLGMSQDKDLTEDKLMLKAQNKELGSLGALLLATRDAKGAEATQRAEAIKEIIASAKELPWNIPVLTPAWNAAGAAGQWLGDSTGQWIKEAGANVNYAGQLPGFVGEGVGRLLTNIEQNGIASTVNTIPKQMSILGLLGAFLIPKGSNWYSPLSLLRNGLIGLAGGSLINQQMYQGGSIWQKGAKYLREMMGFDAPAAAAETNTTETPKAPESKEIAPKIPESMITVLRQQGLTDNDINLAHRYSTAPTSAVLSTMMPELPNAQGGRWDITISPSLGNLFSAEQKEYLRSGKLDEKSMAQGYYRTLELIGRKWKQDMIETMPDGNAFLQERSDAYRGWLVMKRVFSKESQDRVNNNVRDLVGPEQNFATAAYLLLETSDKPVGQNPTLDRMKAAVKEIRRVYREESTMTSKTNTWETYTKGSEKPAAKTAPDKAPAKAVSDTGAETPGKGPREGQGLPTKGERLAEIEAAGIYTEGDFEKIPTAANQVREYMRNQKMKLISLLQSGMANLRSSERPNTPATERDRYYKTSGENLMQRAAGLVEQIRKDSKQFAPGADPEKVVRTVLLDVYRSDKMVGYEEAVEELLTSTKVQGIPPLYRNRTAA